MICARRRLALCAQCGHSALLGLEAPFGVGLRVEVWERSCVRAPAHVLVVLRHRVEVTIGIDGPGEHCIIGHHASRLLAAPASQTEHLTIVMDPEFMEHGPDGTARALHADLPLCAIWFPSPERITTAAESTIGVVALSGRLGACEYFSVDPDAADALHAELVGAFFHPPRIAVCGFEGLINDDVLIVSHLELWPWRTVVRCSVTRPGSIGHNDGATDGTKPIRIWLHDWSLQDDVGTEYRPSGAGLGGDGFCEDVDVRFSNAVPAEATLLTIVAPTGRRIEVALR
jgi:hypothetical protein